MVINNYLNSAFRNLKRHAGHSLVNVLGLSIGIAVCVLLALWVHDELNYDGYHGKANRIFRVISEKWSEGKSRRLAWTPAPLGPALVDEFESVIKAARFSRNRFLVKYKDLLFYDEAYFADPEIFEIFDFPLVLGDARTALNDDSSILISEKMRKKIFGDKNPIGELISLGEKKILKVTGVFKDIKRNSHFRFNFLGKFSAAAGRHFHKWGMSNYYTYLLVSKKFDSKSFEARMPVFVSKYRGKELWEKYKINYPLQPLRSIHLYSHLRGELGANRAPATVYIFSFIVILILFLACINYINLTASRYFYRTKEVGLRKVLGATRADLILQFLVESFLITLAAIPPALSLASLALPTFNTLAGKELTISFWGSMSLLPELLVLTLALGTITGIFPALVISSVQPAMSLKGASLFKRGSKFSWVQKSLVIFQFTVSVIFIISTLIVLQQLNFLRGTALSFDTDNLINLPLYSPEALAEYANIKSELVKNSRVRSVTASNFFLGKNEWRVNCSYENMPPDAYLSISQISIDEDFFKTFKIELVAGRNFSPGSIYDRERAYILNEAAVKAFEWDSPVGKAFELGNMKKGTVIGVVKDFHFQSMHTEIMPAAFCMTPANFAYLTIRISPGDVASPLKFIKKTFEVFVPGETFKYSFMDEDWDLLYRSEARLKDIFLLVTCFALLIAGLGLFGLASFLTGRRNKEIGVRKALGASTGSIMLLMSKGFAGWVLAANILAWPTAWYAMHLWLQGFAYRITIYPYVFLSAGIFSLLAAFLATGYKTVRAAMVAPASVLRYE